MKNLKKLFTLFLALCLMCSLVACEPKDDDDDDDDDEETADQTPNRSDDEDDLVAALAGKSGPDATELNYYYIDALNDYYNGWYAQFTNYTDMYLESVGLNTSLPLNQQKYGNTDTTWADHFTELAINQAKYDYALCNLAKESGFVLSAEDQAAIDDLIDELDRNAAIYGYSNVKTYLTALYGDSASVKSYEAYLQRGAVADAYAQAYAEGLTYTDAEIRAYEKGIADHYNSYTYSTVYLSYTDFLPDGKDLYTDAENAAAREAMKTAAEQLASCATLDALKDTIKTIEVNDISQLSVNDYVNEAHTEINTPLSNWLADPQRREGDIAAIPNETKSTDADGKETTVINGYYVAYFKSKNDNTKPMSNVRHLLVEFEGGTFNEFTYETVYTEEDKQAAKTEAEGYLQTWQEGEANEASFIQLVKQYSDDGSASDGGLFENIHPDSNYVTSFLNWSIDPARLPGDCEIIETEYGYHLMYYVGNSEMSYRDYMIAEDMRMKDILAWQEEIESSYTDEPADTSELELDYIIIPN